jgi:hypothetical protein
MADQVAAYTPTPITQRDGSSLANSNCRMASIATGLDYDTKGAKKSTGKAMRSKQDDQSGGTDSGDAKQAWDRGYGENLSIRDGETWADLLGHLRDGHLVHVDVWHASVGGPCLSGSGAYGHTMVILPTLTGSNWKVSDPWCSPAKWSNVSEAKLKAGAEEWGRRVYGAAALEADYPADSSGPRDPRVLVVVSRIVRRLMSLSYPGHETTMPNPPPADTGGGQPILFTFATSYPPTAGGSTTGGTAVGIYYNPARWAITKDLPVYLDTSGAFKVTTLKAGAVITSLGAKAAHEGAGGDGLDQTWRAVLVNTGGLVDGESPTRQAVLWCRSADMPADSQATSSDWDGSIWSLAHNPDGRFPCPAAPPCPDCPDQAEVIAARDEEWVAWTLEGSPADTA